MAPADPNRILRLLPLFAGIVGGTVLMFNRFATADLTPSQARSDVMGVILSGVLILVGLIWQRVQPRLPDAVELIGREGLEFAPDLPESVKIELAWASHLLLTNTATKSLIVYYQGEVLLRRGILSQNSEVKVSNIIKRVLETSKAVYLVNLNLYPAKIEFDYLPENTQGLICQPIGKEGVLILAANAPRSYTKQDEIWIEGIADKFANTFSQF
ncbi:MAG: cofactor assembly of complex C subunit B [Microcystis aeruginosa Ma_MB_S_20031200_S102]|uniref:Cofactor assembly of complex C subunit B n=1 Tax=Microcystis aeruginosa Ma_MB_S_20031200_S102 TaxID=2486254 RepID=A0A552F656_MICAE|nr:MAG: cofactor assembly of complex C subunit B [Microcystis aeruginosa Ma_MB_S_20031200_S102D]TRU42205.1 MAG: cofactor assembly of complex C subunit B [Microcystis aeruginosa Ma_MB_S_20031200_S102]